MINPIIQRNQTTPIPQNQPPRTTTATNPSALAISAHCGRFFEEIKIFFSHRYADFRMFWCGMNSMGHGTTPQRIEDRIDEINQFKAFVQTPQNNRADVLERYNQLPSETRKLLFSVNVSYISRFQIQTNPNLIEEMRREIVRECEVAASFQSTLKRVNTFYRIFSGNMVIFNRRYDPDPSPPSPNPDNVNLPHVALPGDGPVIEEPALAPNEMINRKTVALERLGRIETMGDARNSQFELNPAIRNFNLDAILERFEARENPSRLCEFFDWAEVEEAKRGIFRDAVSSFDRRMSSREVVLVRTLFSRMHAFFTQRRTQVTTGSPAEEDTKEQFRVIVDRIIDANNNCIDQMLSQLQGMMIDVVADGFASTRGGRQLERIQFRAGHELCKYRINLLKTILVRQNPREGHMADLEREVMRRLADRLGVQGGIFNAGAAFAGIVREGLESKVILAITAFEEEYKPLEFLANELKIPHGQTRKLRAELLQWADRHYALSDEDPNSATSTDMNRRLSANFDDGITGPFADGGEWTPAAALFVLEAANLIRSRT